MTSRDCFEKAVRDVTKRLRLTFLHHGSKATRHIGIVILWRFLGTGLTGMICL